MFERTRRSGTSSVKRRIMNRRNFVTSMLTFAAGLSVTSRAGGQNQAISPDLVKLASKSFKVFNRNVSSLSDKGKKGVHLDESPGDGVAYLGGIEFANGTIEFDVRGK